MAWFALTHYSGLRVSGEGAPQFLDGQLTQKVSALAPGELTLAAWCNAQGRVRALFNVVRGPDAFWLILPADLCAATQQRLRLFILRAAVHLEALTSELGIYASTGSATPLPAGLHERARGQAQLPLQPEQTLVVAAGQTLDAGVLGTHEAWEALQIRLGMPAIATPTSEHWLPQNLNLEALGGLSYQKGCYPGQEIVARVHYRGTVKQHLARYVIEPADGPLPLPGSPCTIAAASDEAPVGEVLRSARGSEGPPEVLLVAEATHAGLTRLWCNGVWLTPVS